MVRDRREKIELYDLDVDLYEKNDVANENPLIVSKINQLMTDSHVKINFGI